MKRIIAFILSVSYLVFISSTVWTVEEQGDYSIALTLINETSATGASYEKHDNATFVNKLKAVKLNKIVKHLAGGGKTKVPRAGLTPTVFSNFVCGLDAHHDILAVPTLTPQLYKNPIFLQNSRLRI